MSPPDERFIRRALELAERGRGLTSPNPMVGAVVVTPSGEIAGEGVHLRAGGPHAEVEALAAAGPRARGATLYVTLEPCAHRGRTPPCASAVVEAAIARVVAAIGDPNPLVAGRGFEILRGASRWISGEPARAHAHRLRSEADAIVVGVTTVLRDDPELTVRLARPWPREPYRVVLDTGARTPPGARLIRAGDPRRVLIAVGGGAPAEARERLAATGATVVPCPTRDGRVDPGALLAELYARDVRGVLVEGGGEVHAGFLDAGLVDRVAFFVAPLLLGGRTAPTAIGGAGRELKGGVRLGALAVTRLGDDLLVEADVVRETRGA